VENKIKKGLSDYCIQYIIGVLFLFIINNRYDTCKNLTDGVEFSNFIWDGEGGDIILVDDRVGLRCE